MKSISQTITPTTKPSQIQEYNSKLRKQNSYYDPRDVLKRAEKELATLEEGKTTLTPESDVFKAITLFEFDKGLLMTRVVPEEYRAFAIDFMQKLQVEYNCVTPSEKANCEIVAVNYCQYLEAQRQLNNALVISDTGKNGSANNFISLMSKEKDRAYRHYESALLNLRTAKQPPMNVTVKAEVANIADKQVVSTGKQQNNHE
jgi:hypothetical protein